jgi:23S rRNA pseudouridine955/2504/2580 synthase
MHIVNTELPIRIDRYLKRIFPNLTQGVIEQLLRHGKIKINDKKGPSSTRVNGGDRILVPSDLVTENEFSKVEQVFSQATVKLADKILNEYLLFEDDNLIAINKPAKLATQGGSKISLSVNDALNFLNNKNGSTLKLVHRLDKETSGILLIAKNYLGANRLADAFKNKIIEKKYIAVVSGAPLKDQGKISSLIAKNREGSFEMMEENNSTGKPAVTAYKVLKKLGNISVIEFMPQTGRTHQLRVHTRALMCPIIGDPKYGSNDNTKSEYMLLHAKYLTIPKEIFDKEIIIKSSLPKYFKKIMGD